MIRTFIAAAVAAVALSAAFAAPAVARDREFVADLAAPIAAPASFVGESLFWRCEGSACRATGTGSAGLQECRRVVRRVGAVTKFGPEATPFSTDRLATCNAGAPAPATAAAAPVEAAPQAVAAQ